MRARLSGAVAVALLALAPACDDDPTSEPEPQPAEVHRRDVFDPATLPEGSSGTLVAARDGELLTCEGWGGGGCDTVYDIGSVTKQFTAAAIVKLQMLGRLDVHDRIGRFLDDVPPDKRSITVEQLLTHTSGLAETLGDDYDRVPRDVLVARALDSGLRWRPGSRYRYSNVGYSLLAAIVEVASGEGYEEFLARHLFEPAGMTQTGYVLPDWDDADVAVEYDARGRPQGRPYDHPWADDGPYWNLRGNGGMLSTARDMFLWYRALEGEEVLDAAAKRELFRPRVREGPGADSRYGYGWVVLDSPVGPVQWHNGGNGWSYAEVARFPRAHAFVFWASNRYRSRADGWNLERAGLTSAVGKRLAGQ